jgi:hypothetical protein
MKKTPKLTPFITSLQLILETPKDLTIGEIFFILSEHGHPALILIFTLPLCFPLQLPGMSTPFGLLIALISIQMGFTKQLWLPHWILQKKLPRKMLHKVVQKIINFFSKHPIKPRLTILTENRVLLKFNGALICILAVILSLPIPIPMINLVSAVPILCLGLGLLRNDGIWVLAGYFFSTVCFLFFSWLINLGFAGVKHLVS